MVEQRGERHYYNHIMVEQSFILFALLLDPVNLGCVAKLTFIG